MVVLNRNLNKNIVISIILVLTITTALIGKAIATEEALDTDIVINEILVNSSIDWDKDGKPDQFIELYNKNATYPKSLSRWRIVDNKTGQTIITFTTNDVVPPNGYLVKYDITGKLNSTGELVLEAYNSTIRKYTTIDTCVYDLSQVVDVSWARNETTGAWTFAIPTPNGTNSPTIELPDTVTVGKTFWLNVTGLSKNALYLVYANYTIKNVTFPYSLTNLKVPLVVSPRPENLEDLIIRATVTKGKISNVTIKVTYGITEVEACVKNPTINETNKPYDYVEVSGVISKVMTLLKRQGLTIGLEDLMRNTTISINISAKRADGADMYIEVKQVINTTNSDKVNVLVNTSNFPADNCTVKVGTSEKVVSLTTFRIGDINNDGEANILDAILIARYDLFGELPQGMPEELMRAIGDINNDGEANILDAIYIARYDLFGEDPLGVFS